MTKIEDNQNGKQPKWKITNKHKKKFQSLKIYDKSLHVYTF